MLIVYQFSCGNAEIGYSELNEKTINYITKYITKTDEQHRGYISTVFVSPGLGKRYVDREIKKHKFNKENTNKRYRLPNGYEKPIPEYYKKKIWSDEEREMLKLIEEEKEEIYINGIKLENPRNEKEARKRLWNKEIENKTYNTKKKFNWKNGTTLQTE